MLRRRDLVIENKSQIGAGGYGEVLLARLRKPNEIGVDVAVKCVWAVGTMGDRTRFAMVSPFTRTLPFPSMSDSFLRDLAVCEGAQNLGLHKTFEYPPACRLLFEQELRDCAARFPISGEWQRDAIHFAYKTQAGEAYGLCKFTLSSGTLRH